jgi:hypothetical protein
MPNAPRWLWFLKTFQVTHQNQRGSSGNPDFDEDVGPPFSTLVWSTTNARITNIHLLTAKYRDEQAFAEIWVYTATP